VHKPEARKGTGQAEEREARADSAANSVVSVEEEGSPAAKASPAADGVAELEAGEAREAEAEAREKAEEEEVVQMEAMVD